MAFAFRDVLKSADSDCRKVICRHPAFCCFVLGFQDKFLRVPHQPVTENDLGHHILLLTRAATIPAEYAIFMRDLRLFRCWWPLVEEWGTLPPPKSSEIPRNNC